MSDLNDPRVLFAAERTLMAWSRTAAGLMALGFLIDRSEMLVEGEPASRAGLWLAFGHAHWGLTLSAITGRLIADLVSKTAPVVDPAPYAAERFSR